MVYQIAGELTEEFGGKFSVMKRYSDFFALKQAIAARWPGFYLPPIPEKKTFGNTEKEFILERKEELDKFVQQLAKY